MLTGAEAKRKPQKSKYVFRDDSLYDTEAMREGVQNTSMRFFCNPLSQRDGSGYLDAKDWPHTNLTQSSMLPNPMQFKPRQLQVVITGASVKDANHLASHGMLEFAYRNRPSITTPLSRFFTVTNGELKRHSEIVITPKNWIQRWLFPSVVLERHEVMDDAVLRYTPQVFGGIPLIEACECFCAKIDLCVPMVPERNILVRLICSGQIGEPEAPSYGLFTPAGYVPDQEGNQE